MPDVRKKIAMKSLFFLLLLACAAAAFPVADDKSSANDDLVTSLPGLSPNPPFAHYSGYLPVGSKQMHYWFAESQGSPTNDPLVLWLNGGPGILPSFSACFFLLALTRCALQAVPAWKACSTRTDPFAFRMTGKLSS
jgi:hypothetical protein